MKKVKWLVFIFVLFLTFVSNVKADEPNIVYSSHVQYQGWQKVFSNGEISGTTGRSLRIEAMKIKLVGINGSVNYQAHVQYQS